MWLRCGAQYTSNYRSKSPTAKKQEKHCLKVLSLAAVLSLPNKALRGIESDNSLPTGTLHICV